MTAQVATIEELIEHLKEIVEAYGNIPACAADGYQAYKHERRTDTTYAPTPQTEVTLIH